MYKYLKSKEFKDVIIDPSTQGLSYDAFKSKPILTKLSYAPKEGVMSLNYLNNIENRKSCIKKWYETVNIGENLILPYHYLSNSEYQEDDFKKWIKINIILINECLSIIEPNKRKYAMISLSLKNIKENEKMLIEEYGNLAVDEFIVQVSDFKSFSKQTLKIYFDFMIKLKNYTNKPIIAFKVPVSLGLTLIAKGIHGFSLGLASKDSFDEENIKDNNKQNNNYSRYYFTKLLSFYSFQRDQKFIFKKAYEYFNGCTCQWCEGIDPIKIATGNKYVQLHCWQKISEEVEKINSIENYNKEKYIEDRIENAINEFEKIPIDIMKNPKNNNYYKLLKNILQVLRNDIDN